MDIEDDKTAVEDETLQSEKKSYSVDTLIEKIDIITRGIALALVAILFLAQPLWLMALISDDVDEIYKILVGIVCSLILLISVILSHKGSIQKPKLFPLIASWVGFLAIYTCVVIYLCYMIGW